MTFDQITALLDRGFTPDQITLLSTSGETPTTPEQVTTGDESSPLDSSPAVTDNTEEQIPDETPTEPPLDSNAAVLDAIADLKKSIQAQNIKTMSVDTIDSDNALEKAMSEIIRPSMEKGV